MSTLYHDGGYIRERKSKCYVAALHEGAKPYKAMLLAAPELLAELKKLYATCVAMDAEQDDDRPEESDYLDALVSAAAAIKAAGAE